VYAQTAAMFCRIEYLNNRAGAKPRIIRTRYRSADSIVILMEFAERERKTCGAAGYRWRDLHTDRVGVVWEVEEDWRLRLGEVDSKSQH
jgi:hypothetical protein